MRWHWGVAKATFALLFAVVCVFLYAGCFAGRRTTHRGPIVLITCNSLRADVVGAQGSVPGLTPNLDRLVGEATWAGRAVAPSSWVVPSMASLFTGLQPWKHQALHARQAVLQEELLTLPEALGELGFRTVAYHSSYWLGRRFGYRQGFEASHKLGKGKRAAGHLASLRGAPVFVWIHMSAPRAPYRLHPAFLDRLPTPPGGLPREVAPVDLEPYYDPAVPLPDYVRERFWSLYCLNVAWADAKLGELLASLKESGQWERTLLVVASAHGEEFGEYGQIGRGGSLGRSLLEVPLVIKMPAGFRRPLEIDSGHRVGTVRLWATVVEAAGGQPVPAAAPSLFRHDDAGVLSELYLRNGVNQFSLVQGPYQLHWVTRFAPPEPEYFAARLSSMGGQARRVLSEPAERIFDRMEAAFLAARPLSGNGTLPQLRLERWTAEGVELVDDPKTAWALGELLRDQWLAYLDAETTPAAVKWAQDGGRPP